MHSTFTILALSALAALTSASPTPTSNKPPLSCTTITPSILQLFSEDDPDIPFPNSAYPGTNFLVSQDAGPEDRIYQAVSFTAIPAGANTCSLHFRIPTDSNISPFGNPVLNISTIAKGDSAAIKSLNSWTWNDLYADPSPIDTGLFGTISNFSDGVVTTINTEACPTDLNGGGNLAFLFSIASWVNGDATVYLNDLASSDDSSVYLTYNC